MTVLGYNERERGSTPTRYRRAGLGVLDHVDGEIGEAARWSVGVVDEVRRGGDRRGGGRASRCFSAP